MEYKCEHCHDTRYYGDNGPGIEGNKEYMPCDQCQAPRHPSICEHGSLRRKCEICERDDEISALKQQLDKAKAEIARLKKEADDTEWSKTELSNQLEQHRILAATRDAEIERLKEEVRLLEGDVGHLWKKRNYYSARAAAWKRCAKEWRSYWIRTTTSTAQICKAIADRIPPTTEGKSALDETKPDPSGS